MDTKRTADVTWEGDLKGGSGRVTAGSGSFTFDVSFGRRFGSDPGTNPEELIAAAHAVCYSMALANTLAKAGSPPSRLQTRATVSLHADDAGAKIGSSDLDVKGTVDGLDEAAFRRVAQDAEKACPVSNALRGNLRIGLEVKLAGGA